jgi:ketosteroid isomerase-like protein
MRLAPAALVAVAVAVAVAGCGGNPDEEARKTVRDFIEATNARDSDRYCEDLVTKAFVEDATGATGKAARDVCKRQLRLQRVPKVHLVDIQRTVVKGDQARVTALLEAGGESHSQVLRLRKEGGNWRIADARGD